MGGFLKIFCRSYTTQLAGGQNAMRNIKW